MSYVSYTGLHTPNDVLEKIAEYVTDRGYTVIANCIDDLDVYTMSENDGKKLVFMDRTGTYFYLLRTTNGTNAIGTSDESAMDVTPKQTGNTYGILMTISEGYSVTTRWYNQHRVPKEFGSDKVIADFLPIPQYDNLGNSYNYSYTLFCNEVFEPENYADTLCFTLMKENDSYRQCAHLIFGTIQKYDTWDGGAFFTASANYKMQETCQKCFEHNKNSDEYIRPPFSSGMESTTFLRADIEGATMESRKYVFWASSGTDNLTGKKLSLPIRTTSTANGKIPNYLVLQSTSNLDWGRNVNTLNCLSINYPLYASVIRDPDAMALYSAVGQFVGVYFVNTLNMQTSYVYKLNYPSSNDLCQVFSVGHRRGKYGYDSISIRQVLEESDEPVEPGGSESKDDSGKDIDNEDNPSQEPEQSD